MIHSPNEHGLLTIARQLGFVSSLIERQSASIGEVYVQVPGTPILANFSGVKTTPEFRILSRRKSLASFLHGLSREQKRPILSVFKKWCSFDTRILTPVLNSTVNYTQIYGM